MEVLMGKRLRKVKAIVALIVACGVATIPACGSMGGGTRYLIEPPVEVSS
jgi:hypothetical protein